MSKKIITDNERISTDFYKPYIGCYAKRFYTPFEEKNLCKIVGFRLDEFKPRVWDSEKKVLVEKDENCYYAMFKIQGYDRDGELVEWEWDVEDCVIIVDEHPMKEDPDEERIADVKHPQYKGYNPYKDIIIG